VKRTASCGVRPKKRLFSVQKLFYIFSLFFVRFSIFRHYYTEEQKLFFAGTRLPDPFRLQRSWMTERGLAEKEFL
jgi:hypothetical protein